MKNLLLPLLLVAVLFAPGCADGFLSSSSKKSEDVTLDETESRTPEYGDTACHNLLEEDERIDRPDCAQ